MKTSNEFHSALRCTQFLVGCAMLLLMACSDNPADSTDGGPKSSVRLTSPKMNDVRHPGSTLHISWVVRDGATAPDSIRLEYRGLDPVTEWRLITSGATTPSAHDLRLPDTLRGRFEIRIQGTGDEVWDVVSPLYAMTIMIRITAPTVGQDVLAGSTIPIEWDLVFPENQSGYDLTETGTIEIQYSAIGTSMSWTTAIVLPAVVGSYSWRLPVSINHDFAIRARSTFDSIWTTVSPIHLLLSTVHLTSPAAKRIYRVGDIIPVRWESLDPLGAYDTVVLECRVGSGSWREVGRYSFAQGGVDWTPTDISGKEYSLRIRNAASPNWDQVDEIRTAELRILDFPPGSTIARGTPFSLNVKVDVPWSANKEYTLMLSSDGGASWVPALSGGSNIFDHPQASDCRFRVSREDLPFADTSAIFSITENLVDFPVLAVGQHYVYEYVALIWQMSMGGTHVTPRGFPDVHIVVHGKTVYADRTVYDVSHWNAGKSDTIRTTVTESHEGLHRVTGDFRPFSIERIFARLDGSAEKIRYRWGENYQFDLDRNRGLVYAVERINTGYQETWDHTFTLKP
jgi:hypothetical protein